MAIIPEAAAEREKLEKDLAAFKDAETRRVAELLSTFKLASDLGGDLYQPNAEELAMILQGVVYVLRDDTLRAHIARVRDCKKLLDSYGPAPE